MGIKYLAIAAIILAGLYPYDALAVDDTRLYADTDSGFAFRYTDYWNLVTDIDEMLAIQDGTIDLINQEYLSSSEKNAYKAMLHVAGSPRYKSNIVFMAYRHQRDGRAAYPDSNAAIEAVNDAFEAERASGTYSLQDTWLGDSHAYIYRRTVHVDQWNDDIRITYYITASTTHAYMLVESVMMSALNNVALDQFNQAIMSFRVEANETVSIDPSLDWGSIKPGEDTIGGGGGEPVGQTEIIEDFRNNSAGWPTGDDSYVTDGSYVLDSSKGYPFTVRNTAMGQIEFDFSYEGAVTFIDGDENAGYGLVFGYQDANNYYAFLINHSDQFIVIREQNGRVTNLIDWTSSDLLSGDSHDLLVQGDYQTITQPRLTHRYQLIFYVDNTPVGIAEVGDVLQMSGWYGVFVSSDLKISFDSLTSRNYLIDSVMTLERFQ